MNADLSLENAALKDIIAKSLRPAERREVATHIAHIVMQRFLAPYFSSLVDDFTPNCL